MDIAWIGHAAFRLRGRDGALVTDPCPTSTGFRLNRPQADIVTISNPDDPSHAWYDGVAGEPLLLDAPGEYESRNILVTGVAGPLSASHEGEPPAHRSVAFVITIDDVIVAHFGDPPQPPPSDQLDELSRADVLLVPVGGRGHLDAKRAAQIVATLEPKLVIPMLYKVGPETADLDGVEPFLNEMGIKLPDEVDNHINLSRSSLPGHTTVHVLTPRGG